MKYRLVTFISALAFVAGLGGIPNSALASSLDYAEHTPGGDFLNEGTRDYRAGNYGRALGNFRRAARWAEKLAQHNIGVMYYHGQGLDQNLPRALAWFRLSAERQYPQMVEMVDHVESELDEEQIARAETILEEELLPEYGDEVAVPRTARRMDRERRRATGSRTGAIGALTVIDRSGQTRSGRDFYDDDKWDFFQIVEFETELFEGLAGGQVRLRDVETEEDSSPESDD